jgi:hypothetical protein
MVRDVAHTRVDAIGCEIGQIVFPMRLRLPAFSPVQQPRLLRPTATIPAFETHCPELFTLPASNHLLRSILVSIFAYETGYPSRLERVLQV